MRVWILADNYQHARLIAHSQEFNRSQWVYLHPSELHKIRGMEQPVILRSNCRVDTQGTRDILVSRRAIIIEVKCPTC